LDPETMQLIADLCGHIKMRPTIEDPSPEEEPEDPDVPGMDQWYDLEILLKRMKNETPNMLRDEIQCCEETLKEIKEEQQCQETKLKELKKLLIGAEKVEKKAVKKAAKEAEADAKKAEVEKKKAFHCLNQVQKENLKSWGIRPEHVANWKKAMVASKKQAEADAKKAAKEAEAEKKKAEAEKKKAEAEKKKTEERLAKKATKEAEAEKKKAEAEKKKTEERLAKKASALAKKAEAEKKRSDDRIAKKAAKKAAKNAFKIRRTGPTGPTPLEKRKIAHVTAGAEARQTLTQCRRVHLVDVELLANMSPLPGVMPVRTVDVFSPSPVGSASPAGEKESDDVLLARVKEVDMELSKSMPRSPSLPMGYDTPEKQGSWECHTPDLFS